MCVSKKKKKKRGARERVERRRGGTRERERLGHSNLVNLVSCLKAAGLKDSESLGLQQLTQNHLLRPLFA